MSRGGRRGWGGGGGGRGGGRIAGADVPWAYDPDLKPDYKPSELFPPIQQVVPKPLSRYERLQVAHYRSLRDRVHEGPLYTILGDESRVTKPGAPTSTMIDPFEGMPTYAQKYRKKTRRMPRLDTRPYVLRFFPKELWSTLDPDHELKDEATTRKKTLKIAMSSGTSALEDFTAGEGGPSLDPDRALPKTEGDDEAGGGDDEERVVPDEDGVEEEEEVDEDYESDEDETAGDYGAEAYFDDGADDDRDDHEGGGGDDEGPLM
ncbi:MAG: hypothetical protein M1832_001401 [Thelocarpon impressellum]|nr:MAG: hypothetical protein M1832_001401 [Thelocarpon impressellum]